MREYDSIIKSQLQQGIVEMVELLQEEFGIQEESERVHYLPHHAVIRQDKETTKLRRESLSLNNLAMSPDPFPA